MKPLRLLLAGLLLFTALSGCGPSQAPAQIAATTGPVYTFTAALCQNTGLTVTQLVTESVSCLHDYSLSVPQARAAEAAQLIVLSGAGLEDFMADLLAGKPVIDSSMGFVSADTDHWDEADPHFWLLPENAGIMAETICSGLCAQYPAHAARFSENLQDLLARLEALRAYGDAQLSDLKTRELITFHDGFSYFARGFDLSILKAVEEESGSEASASELKELIGLVRSHALPAIFTEEYGSTSAAQIIFRETGARIYALTMGINSDYFTAMYHNIDTVKEALG